MPSNSSTCSSPPLPCPFRGVRSRIRLAIFLCLCVCEKHAKEDEIRMGTVFFSAIGKMEKKTICKKEIIKSVKSEQTVFSAAAQLAVALSF